MTHSKIYISRFIKFLLNLRIVTILIFTIILFSNSNIFSYASKAGDEISVAGTYYKTEGTSRQIIVLNANGTGTIDIGNGGVPQIISWEKYSLNKIAISLKGEVFLKAEVAADGLHQFGGGFYSRNGEQKELTSAQKTQVETMVSADEKQRQEDESAQRKLIQADSTESFMKRIRELYFADMVGKYIGTNNVGFKSSILFDGEGAFIIDSSETVRVKGTTSRLERGQAIELFGQNGKSIWKAKVVVNIEPAKNKGYNVNIKGFQIIGGGYYERMPITLKEIEGEYIGSINTGTKGNEGIKPLLYMYDDGNFVIDTTSEQTRCIGTLSFDEQERSIKFITDKGNLLEKAKILQSLTPDGKLVVTGIKIKDGQSFNKKK